MSYLALFTKIGEEKTILRNVLTLVETKFA